MSRHQARDAYPLWRVLLAHLVELGPCGLYSHFTEMQWTPTLVKSVVISASANVLYFMGLLRAHAPTNIRQSPSFTRWYEVP